jgi:hypothetical protein
MASEAGLSKITEALADLSHRNSAQRPPPLNLQGDKAANWKVFKQILEISLKASRRTDNDDKTAWLYASVGPEALLLI